MPSQSNIFDPRDTISHHGNTVKVFLFFFFTSLDFSWQGLGRGLSKLLLRLTVPPCLLAHAPILRGVEAPSQSYQRHMSQAVGTFPICSIHAHPG